MEFQIEGQVFGVERGEEISLRVGNSLYHFKTNDNTIDWYGVVLPLFLNSTPITLTGILHPELTEQNVGVWASYFYLDYVSGL